MADASFLLQQTFNSLLLPTADPKKPGFSALLNAGVFDQVPAGATMPYVTIGEAQVLGDRINEVPQSEIHSTIHVWSMANGKGEAKAIAGRVRDVLDGNIAVPGFACYGGRHSSTVVLTEVDGDKKITHLVMIFEHILKPTV